MFSHRVKNSDIMASLKGIERRMMAIERGEHLKTVVGKIDDIYFENEIVKHNLYLDQELRNLKDEINKLKVQINKTIQGIDLCLKEATSFV
jgi:hypothetical protein